MAIAVPPPFPHTNPSFFLLSFGFPFPFLFLVLLSSPPLEIDDLRLIIRLLSCWMPTSINSSIEQDKKNLFCSLFSPQIFSLGASSASVLAVSLIASYLQVPLRYPLRLGGSQSYICDYAPAIDHSMHSSDSNSISLTSSKLVEFPHFIEGQDSTRAAYAVFLLNKWVAFDSKNEKPVRPQYGRSEPKQVCEVKGLQVSR